MGAVRLHLDFQTCSIIGSHKAAIGPHPAFSVGNIGRLRRVCVPRMRTLDLVHAADREAVYQTGVWRRVTSPCCPHVPSQVEELQMGLLGGWCTWCLQVTDVAVLLATLANTSSGMFLLEMDGLQDSKDERRFEPSLGMEKHWRMVEVPHRRR